MSQTRHSEASFKTVIETRLLANGYVAVNRDGFDRQWAIFPKTVLAFIRTTQPKEWARLEALLRREDRLELAQACFAFLPARGRLDLLGYVAPDIFTH